MGSLKACYSCILYVTKSAHRCYALESATVGVPTAQRKWGKWLNSLSGKTGNLINVAKTGKQFLFFF